LKYRLITGYSLNCLPSGAKANIKIDIPTTSVKDMGSIDEVRKLLQKEMAQKGTSQIKSESEAGWEAHFMERYAQP
jgi:hypothetical protein